MVTSRRPISFIATDQADAAAAFYADILGLALVERSPFALVFDDAGIMLRIQIVPDVHPPAYTAHGWQVANIRADMAALRSKGVEFKRFAHLPQDEDGVWELIDGLQRID